MHLTYQIYGLVATQNPMDIQCWLLPHITLGCLASMAGCHCPHRGKEDCTTYYYQERIKLCFQKRLFQIIRILGMSCVFTFHSHLDL